MLSHSAVLRLWWLKLTLQSLSHVLARYDPFGVDVPLNFDIIHSLRTAQQIYCLHAAWDCCLSIHRSSIIHPAIFCKTLFLRIRQANNAKFWGKLDFVTRGTVVVQAFIICLSFMRPSSVYSDFLETAAWIQDKFCGQHSIGRISRQFVFSIFTFLWFCFH